MQMAHYKLTIIIIIIKTMLNRFSALSSDTTFGLIITPAQCTCWTDAALMID